MGRIREGGLVNDNSLVGLQFDPDRFAPPREEDRCDQFALIGFGGGAHSCLGLAFAQMEMKLILAGLLKQYDWEATPAINGDSYPMHRIYQQNAKLRAKLVPIKAQVEAIARVSGLTGGFVVKLAMTQSILVILSGI